MRTNRPELALLEYEAVLAQVPGDRAARSSTVRVTASMGRSEEALKRAEAWLAETPDDASLCATTGLVYLNEGNPGRARPLLECSLGDGIHRPGVNLALGRMALNDGDQDLAFSYLHGELEVNPNNLDAHRAIAGLLMSRDAWEEAATEYSFVADADPTDLAARVAHAQATFNLGDYDGAEALVTLALDVDPELPEGLMLLANIYAKTDRMDEGKALADRANDLRERQVEAQATP
jgi:predicted Zn-dependent protease